MMILQNSDSMHFSVICTENPIRFVKTFLYDLLKISARFAENVRKSKRYVEIL